MTKKRLAPILTIVILATALGVTLARKNSWTLRPPPDATPEDAIYAMLDAAKKGDVPRPLPPHPPQHNVHAPLRAPEKSHVRVVTDRRLLRLPRALAIDPLLPHQHQRARHQIQRDRQAAALGPHHKLMLRKPFAAFVVYR